MHGSSRNKVQAGHRHFRIGITVYGCVHTPKMLKRFRQNGYGRSQFDCCCCLLSMAIAESAKTPPYWAARAGVLPDRKHNLI